MGRHLLGRPVPGMDITPKARVDFPYYPSVAPVKDTHWYTTTITSSPLSNDDVDRIAKRIIELIDERFAITPLRADEV